MLNNIIKLNPKVLKPIFEHYTAGQNIKSLTNKINYLENEKIFPIADYIKENVNNNNDIKNIIIEYKNLANVYKLKYIAIKLSSFNFDYGKINQTCEYLIKKK